MNSDKRPEISVIMLTYNREKLISQMIECILSQTFDNFEFIIVDNGSTDKSGKIADNYAEMDSRINVIHRNKGSIGSGRNTGLDFAKGKYIAFVDDDDTCDKDFLDFLYKLIIDNNADAAICGATWSDNDEKRIMQPQEAVEMLLWRKNYNVAFPTKLFKAELFIKNRFLETGKYDDIYLMPKILASAELIAYHGISKYSFNRHDNNNSAWTQHHELLDNDTLTEYLKVYDERTAWLSEIFPEKTEIWHYFNYSFMISMVDKISRYNLIGCFDTRKLLIDCLKKNKSEFYECKWISDTEKKWMECFILSDLNN